MKNRHNGQGFLLVEFCHEVHHFQLSADVQVHGGLVQKECFRLLG